MKWDFFGPKANAWKRKANRKRSTKRLLLSLSTIPTPNLKKDNILNWVTVHQKTSNSKFQRLLQFSHFPPSSSVIIALNKHRVDHFSLALKMSFLKNLATSF